MTCREFTDFIHSYLDRELPDAERSEFEHHLALCEPCVRYLESYRRTLDLCKSAYVDEQEPVPNDVPEELIQAILASRRDRDSD